MIKLTTLKIILGNTVTFDSTSLKDWGLLQVLKIGNQYDCLVTIGDIVAKGQCQKSQDGNSLTVVFNSRLSIPENACLYIDVEEIPTQTPCPNNKVNINKDTKIAVVGNDGCHIGYATIGEILSMVVTPSFCDLVPNIPAGNLIASDKIVVSSGGCDLKTIPQSDIFCK